MVVVIASIASDGVTIALIGGLITLAVNALLLRHQDKGAYVDDLEAWVAALKAERAENTEKFEAKNRAQDQAIFDLQQAVAHCESERVKEKEAHTVEKEQHQQEIFRLWTKVNSLQGNS